MSKKRGRPAGYVMSKESKQKISDSLKGRKFSEKHKKNLSKSMMGNTNRKNKN